MTESRRRDRRNKVDIKMDILECCLLPSTRTDISFSTMLPYAKSNVFLIEMVNMGLIEPSNKIYTYGVEFLTTAKGGNIYRNYKKIMNELKDLKEVFEELE